MKRTYVTMGLVALMIAGCGGRAKDRASQAPQNTGSNYPSSNYPSSTSQTISGTVDASSDTSLVITTAAGQMMTMRVDQSSNVPHNLNPGDQVQVTYAQSGNTNRVTSIQQLSSSQNTGQGASNYPSSNYPSQQGTTPSGTSSTQPGGTSSSSSQYGTTPSTGSTGTTTDQYGNQTTTGTESTNMGTTSTRHRRSRAAGTQGALPGTASNLPLTALAGLLAVGAGLGIQALRKV